MVSILPMQTKLLMNYSTMIVLYCQRKLLNTIHVCQTLAASETCLSSHPLIASVVTAGLSKRKYPPQGRLNRLTFPKYIWPEAIQDHQRP